MSAPQIKVSYFDMHGRADLTRLILTFAKVPFVDERLSFAQWAEIKHTTPLRKAPLMQVDGKTYVQSMAMARYAAKVAGLYPSDTLEAFHAEMISDTLCELFEMFVDINFHTKDAATKAEKSAAFVSEAAPLKLGMLEGLVRGKFFMGDEPSFVDIQLFDTVHNALYKKIPGFSATEFPKLEAIAERIKADPNVAAYLKKHNLE